jgi:hypothetical protein
MDIRRLKSFLFLPEISIKSFVSLEQKNLPLFKNKPLQFVNMRFFRKEQDSVIKSKRIPSIFKVKSTGSCICLWKLAVAVATYVSLLTTMQNISQLDNNANCISMAALNTLCIVDRLLLHSQQ